MSAEKLKTSMGKEFVVHCGVENEAAVDAGNPALGPLWAATASAFPTVLFEKAKFPTVVKFRIRCCLRCGLGCIDFRVTKQWLLNVQLRS